MAITVIHSKRYAFAWHIIGRSWYVPSDPVNDYATGESKPNYPVPAIPQIYQWDFSLWVLLETIPPLTEDEWDREEEAWQDYLDSLDKLN